MYNRSCTTVEERPFEGRVQEPRYLNRPLGPVFIARRATALTSLRDSIHNVGPLRGAEAPLFHVTT